MEKIKIIIVWCFSIYSILLGICSNKFSISNILFILAGLCIMPPIVKKVTKKTTQYNKKVKWIIFIILTLLAYSTYPVSNNFEDDNIIQEQIITENYTIDYLNAGTLEEDLNHGIDINGKIVKFKVKEYVKDSAIGYNAHSGEHLNFISETDLKLESNVEVIGKITSYKDFFGSWIINYEIIKIDSNVIDQMKKEIEEQPKEEIEEQPKGEIEEQPKEEMEEQPKVEIEEQPKEEIEEQPKGEIEEQPKEEIEEQTKGEIGEQTKEKVEEQVRQESEKPNSTVTEPSFETGNVLVWIPTNGGKKYHSRSGCSNMKNPNQVTKATAEANGFTPCAKCY